MNFFVAVVEKLQERRYGILELGLLEVTKRKVFDHRVGMIQGGGRALGRRGAPELQGAENQQRGAALFDGALIDQIQQLGK